MDHPIPPEFPLIGDYVDGVRVIDTHISGWILLADYNDVHADYLTYVDTNTLEAHFITKPGA